MSNRGRRGYKGKYLPKNPTKYNGDPHNIIYRSLLERRFMVWLDLNPTVLSWASEERAIPYLSPIDGKIHRYFPDFIITYKNTKDEIKNVVIEIKPDSQTKEPKFKGRKTQRYLEEVSTYLINQAKWKYASEWASKNNATFQILTEKDLKIQNK